MYADRKQWEVNKVSVEVASEKTDVTTFFKKGNHTGRKPAAGSAPTAFANCQCVPYAEGAQESDGNQHCIDLAFLGF
jgi:hypothetical protein